MADFVKKPLFSLSRMYIFTIYNGKAIALVQYLFGGSYVFP